MCEGDDDLPRVAIERGGCRGKGKRAASCCRVLLVSVDATHDCFSQHQLCMHVLNVMLCT